MVEIRLTKVNSCSIYKWLDISLLGCQEIAVEAEVKIFELKFDSASLWEEPSVGSLVRMNLPILERWEIDFHHWLLKLVYEFEFNIVNIEGSYVVSDLIPIVGPGKYIKHHFEIIMIARR